MYNLNDLFIKKKNLNDNFTVGGIVSNEGGGVLVMLVADIPYPCQEYFHLKVAFKEH